MKKWLLNKSIIFKLLVTGGTAFLAIVLLSSAIMAYFFYKNYTAGKIHTIAETVERQVFLARIAEKNFVRIDLNKSRFYQTGRSEYLGKNRVHLSNARAEILKLTRRWSGARAQKAQELLELTDRYRLLFSEMVQTYREIGFKDWGLLGEWRRAIHNVEHAVPPDKQFEFYEAILQLRRLEKDYLLRGDKHYLEAIKTQLTLLRSLVSENNGINPPILLVEIDRYEEAFERYLLLQEKIGRTDREGLQKDFAEVLTQINPAIDRIYMEAKAENLNARQALITASVIVYLMGFILGGAGFYYFARAISARLTVLKNAVSKVGQGHLNIRLADDHKDEIGILTEAFNDMASDLNAITVSKRELRVLSSKMLEAQEDERKMVARELHDGIGQALTGIKFCIENGIRKLEEGCPVSQVSEIDKAIQLIRGAVEEVRRISMGLRPSTLDDIGIAETVFWYCRQFEEIYRTIRIQTFVDVEEHRISDYVKTAIFRIIQESLNNVAKHSRADRVRLALQNDGDRLELKIEDNGAGFETVAQTADEPVGGGFGLAGMKERAELSGGSLSVHSVLDKGTRIMAVWSVKS